MFGTLAATLGVVFVAVPKAAASAPHEKAYTAGGIEYTVGHTDFAARAVAPVNGMPTNREAVVDNTTYGRFTGSGSGTLTMGYLVGCQLEVDTGLSLEADIGVDGDVGAGVDVDTDGADPSADAGIGADASAGVGVDLDLAQARSKKSRSAKRNWKPGQPATSTAATPISPRIIAADNSPSGDTASSLSTAPRSALPGLSTPTRSHSDHADRNGRPALPVGCPAPGFLAHGESSIPCSLIRPRSVDTPGRWRSPTVPTLMK